MQPLHGFLSSKYIRCIDGCRGNLFTALGSSLGREWWEKIPGNKACLLRHPQSSLTRVLWGARCTASPRQMCTLFRNALLVPVPHAKGLTLLSLIMLHLIAIHLISCINVISFYIGKQLRAMIEFHSISLNKHANWCPRCKWDVVR